MTKATKKSKNQKKFHTRNFKTWSFATINIQSGHEKNDKKTFTLSLKNLPKRILHFAVFKRYGGETMDLRSLTLIQANGTNFTGQDTKRKDKQEPEY